MPGDSRLKHNPFANLRSSSEARPAPPRRTAAPAPPAPPEAPALGRVIVREELDAEEGGLVTRVLGVPPARLRPIGAKVRSALSARVLIEGRDLLVAPSDCERVAAWFREQGASDVVIVAPEPRAELERAGRAGGTVRAEIRRGLRVAIVTKADQETGTLTEGTVRDILTRSAKHPRGIKVRLESGEVGRVRRILEGG